MPRKKSLHFFLLTLILLGGLGLRLMLAPTQADNDTLTYRGWMESTVKLGLVESYVDQRYEPRLINYPPVIPLLLEGSGYLYKTVVSPDYRVIDPVHMVFAKLPAMLADLATCMLLFFLVRRLKNERFALTAAGIYALHPAVLFDSTLWGQTDSIYTLFLLASLMAFLWKRPALGTALAVLACFAKPQAIVFVPLLLFLLDWDHRTLERCLVAGGGVAMLLLLPFAVSGHLPAALATFNPIGALHESHLSWRAYNLWWMLLGPSARDVPSSALAGGVVSYGLLGMVLAGFVYLMILLGLNGRLRRLKQWPGRAASVLESVAVLSLGIFFFGPEMHERYLFHFLPLALPLAFVWRRWAWLYACVSVLFLLNLAGAYDRTSGTWLFQTFPWLPVAVAALLMACLALASASALSGAGAELGRFFRRVEKAYMAL